jgi:hypothetical protein
MKKLVLSLCFAAGILSFTGCSKDDNDSPTGPDYAHLTAGSSWTYKFTEGTSPSETFKLTVANKDTVANQKTYKVITRSDGGANNYTGKVGNDYYRFASFPDLGINSFEELYLKADQPVNATWNNQANVVFGGTPIPANLTYTIKGKGESRTVLGNSFNNVIRVRIDISASGLGLGGADFYYAEGIGLIESDIAVTAGFGQNYTAKQELISSDLK